MQSKWIKCVNKTKDVLGLQKSGENNFRIQNWHKKGRYLECLKKKKNRRKEKKKREAFQSMMTGKEK